jgi:hypothetical protein
VFIVDGSETGAQHQLNLATLRMFVFFDNFLFNLLQNLFEEVTKSPHGIHEQVPNLFIKFIWHFFPDE